MEYGGGGGDGVLLCVGGKGGREGEFGTHLVAKQKQKDTNGVFVFY